MAGRSGRVGLLLVGLMLTALLGGRAAPVTAAGVLDANFAPTGNIFYQINAGVSVGQTFLAGSDGRLDRGGVLISRQASAITLRFELWAVDGSGLPTGAALTSQLATLPGGVVETAWLDATFASPVTVTAGVRYALMVYQVTSTLAYITVGFSDGFPGGAAIVVPAGSPAEFLGSGVDVGFRVSIEPPGPRYSLTGAATPNPAVLGQPMAFVFTAANAGPGAGTNSLLTVTLPAGVQQQGAMTVVDGGSPVPGASCTLRSGAQISCALGAMAVGASYTITIPTKIVAGTLGAQYCAQGLLSGGIAGVNAGAATARACVRTTIPGDLTASLNCPTTLASDADLPSVCTVTVRNVGGAAVTVPSGAVLVTTSFSGAASNWGPGGLVTPVGYAAVDSTIGGSIAAFSGQTGYMATAVDVIPPGGTRVFSATMATLLRYAGSHTVTATVDPNSVIAEANKSNNSAGPAVTTIEPPP